MIVVIAGRVKTDAERRGRLIDVGQRVAQASREEPGCASYRLYEDTERPNEFVFVEVWESEEALGPARATWPTSADAELHRRGGQQPTLGRVPLTATQPILTCGCLRDRIVNL